ncbi:hypothetical protein [Streptomyces fagopyri]|uniref:hypothetical protein n=1 Tax=Streptomyces fagopyri TaxID=2662397 RepID=UPI0033CD02C3
MLIKSMSECVDAQEVNRLRAALAMFVADVFASVPRKDRTRTEGRPGAAKDAAPVRSRFLVFDPDPMAPHRNGQREDSRKIVL